MAAAAAVVRDIFGDRPRIHTHVEPAEIGGGRVTSVPRETLGVVVIGRNEGERLRACFDSLAGVSAVVVYVYSASVDGSVALAKSRGIEVVELDDSDPCTAARSRNAGLRRLREIAPAIQWVHFIDGDCTIVPGWIGNAIDAAANNERLAVVCGRRRERFPHQSIYNRLCDLEWNTPIGDDARGRDRTGRRI